jgi:hypothetical protein
LGGRTIDDGHALRLLFIGGPDYDPNDPCSIDYQAQFEETTSEVRIVVTQRHPPNTSDDVACVDLGYLRVLEVPLAAPLGNRTVMAMGAERQLFDGSTLVEPTWMPAGWVAGGEEPGYPDPNSGHYWSRRWGPPPPAPSGDRCTPSVVGVALTEGPPDLVERFPTEMGEQPVGTYDINGASATYSTRSDHGIARLSWRTADRGFVLKASPACLGDQPPPIEVMLKFAASLGSQRS